MTNPLNELKVDHWWHAFTVTGAAGFVTAIAVEPKVIPQRDLLLVSLSLFIFGVGQWINHPRQEQIGRGFKITGFHRRTYPLGLGLELLGVAIFVLEIFRLAFMS